MSLDEQFLWDSQIGLDVLLLLGVQHTIFLKDLAPLK